MEKVQGIVMECGTCGATQHLFTPQHAEVEARLLAEVMDGTSSIFVYKTKPDRSDCLPGSMGRCGICALASPQRTGVFTCKLFGYAERAPAKVIAMALSVQVGDEPVSGMVLPEVTSPGQISAAAANSGIDMEVRVVDVPDPGTTRTADNSTTTDGKEPRPGFEDAPAPAPVRSDGMHEAYYVLSPEERAKGFCRPVRRSYKHVGAPAPKAGIRPLTADELERYKGYGYVAFEPYPPERAPITGSFWTQAHLDRIGRGCGAVTTMAREIAETYARSPRYYGSTFCIGCRTHLPIGEDGEFVWERGENQHVDGERVGT